MKATIVGSGAAFTMFRNFTQSVLLEEEGDTLLLDCGRTTPEGLAKIGKGPKDIKSVYISHAHNDHIGGLEWLGFMNYDWLNKPTHFSQGKYAPKLIANEKLIQELWDWSLKGGLRGMEGFEATLETFFQTVPVKPNEHFCWHGWDIQLIQQLHIMAGSIVVHTYGLLFKKPGHQTVYFTMDSQHCSPSQMQVFYKQADIIFQDCEVMGVNLQFQEGEKVYKDPKFQRDLYKPWPSDAMEAMELMAQGIDPQVWGCFKLTSGVHASYAQLAAYPSANHIQLPIETRNKMWLSHFQDCVLDNKDFAGNPVNWQEQAKKDGFKGFVMPGQVFEF